MPPTSWLSPQEAADLLGVHVDTLKRWAKDGSITGTKTVGGWWRFDPAVIAAHIAEHTNTTEATA